MFEKLPQILSKLDSTDQEIVDDPWWYTALYKLVLVCLKIICLSITNLSIAGNY